jgi:hypothetical protein
LPAPFPVDVSVEDRRALYAIQLQSLTSLIPKALHSAVQIIIEWIKAGLRDARSFGFYHAHFASMFPKIKRADY